MDRRLLTIAREIDPRYERLIPRDAEAMLLVEFQCDSRDELREKLQNLVVQLQRRKKLATAAFTALEREERDFYWRLARRVVPRLHRLRGQSRPVPFIEDLAVPPPALPDFLVRLQNVFKTHEVTASLFGHAGHGQLHVRPFLDISNPADIRKMHDLAADVYAEVMSVGGTISGEHGDGLSRTWYVRRQFGPLYDVFREVKRIFDPQNIFNPGKVVADVPQPLTKNLRPVVIGGALAGEPAATLSEFENSPPTTGSAPVVSAPFELHLVWPSPEELAYTARNCNGCGRCRTQSDDTRMCPIFRIAPAEEASPRAKANLVRAVLTGRLKGDQLSSEACKAIADLCVNCHQCRLECPASVDIPKLVLEAKSQYVVMNGLTTADYFLSRLDRVASWAALVRPFANWTLANRQLRWLLEKMFGLAQGRKLPRLARRNFLRVAARRRLTKPVRQTGRKVLYFVDTYANWFDVQLADACVQVLAHNGTSVYVHPGQLPSVMAQITLGDIERAKPIAAKNIELLADAVRQGYEIVCTEPSAALALTHEYLNLVNDDDAQLVAAHTHEACAYLWNLHKAGQLELDLRPVNVTVGYHTPCHIKALAASVPDEPTAGLNLLGLIPGLSVREIERGCSGMAGTFGLKRENYRASLRAGRGLITSLRDPEIHFGATQCSACKLQMEQGTTKPTLHPLKLLAYSYHLMPELVALLNSQSEELIVT
jgi:Fe-S oxidoreductase